MGLVGIKVQEVIKDVHAISEALGSGMDPKILNRTIQATEAFLEEMKSCPGCRDILYLDRRCKVDGLCQNVYSRNKFQSPCF